VLAASGLLDTLLDGAVPVLAVALATAVVTVVNDRRRKSEAKAKKLAELEEGEIPEWGKKLQDDMARVTRSLYGDQPWGAQGFFVEFGTFKNDVLGALNDLRGNK
jgi:hypothetical protein